MSGGGVPYRIPGKRRHEFVVEPTTRLGKWAVGLVAVTVVLAVAAFTVVPEDSLAAVAVGIAGLASVLAGGVVSFVAIVRRGERALVVYASTVVLSAGVVFLLLHSLFISD